MWFEIHKNSHLVKSFVFLNFKSYFIFFKKNQNKQSSGIYPCSNYQFLRRYGAPINTLTILEFLYMYFTKFREFFFFLILGKVRIGPSEVICIVNTLTHCATMLNSN